MKNKILLMSLGLVLGLGACQESEYMLFNEDARIQMDEKKEMRMNFVYLDHSVVRDTAYLTVNTIGNPVDRPRKLAFRQISEYDFEKIYDDKGNLVRVDTTEKPNKAVAGKHYLPMDSPEMGAMLVVPANAVTVEVPVILLRDASLKKEEVRLCLELVANEEFKLGDRSKLSSTIVFTDKMSRPGRWNASIEKWTFGLYSERKHQFMFEVAGEKIDDDWFARISRDYAESSYYKNKFKNALDKYNKDPENIKNNLAPMREDQNDPESPLVTFPR